MGNGQEDPVFEQPYPYTREEAERAAAVGACLVNHKSPQTDYRWKSNHWKLAELVAARYCTLTELPLPRATHSTANMALHV